MRTASLSLVLIHALLALWLADLKPSPNPIARALPVVSLVEQGTLRIDAFHEGAMDKAFVNGHYYSDKAPLSSFLTVPFYFVLERTGLAPASPSRGSLVLFLGVLVCSALPFALLVTLAHRSIAKTAPVSGVPRVLLASLPFYGSFVFVYSGVFYGHVLAALGLLLSWLALERGDDTGDTLAGAALGFATLAEYTTALALLPWTVHLLRSRARPLRSLLCLGAGGAPLAAALLLYNAATTGSPFQLLYQHEAEAAFQAMSQQLGFRLDPRGILEGLMGLLLGPYRGLLFFAPASLLLAVLALRSGAHRGAWLHPLCLLAALYLLLLSSYYMWWGGSAYGPRHLLPPVAVLFYEGVGLLARSRFPRSAFYGLCGLGLVFALAAKVTVGELMSQAFANPLFELVFPRFLSGKVNAFLAPTLAFGVHAYAVLALWIAGFAAALAWLVRGERGREPVNEEGHA